MNTEAPSSLLRDFRGTLVSFEAKDGYVSANLEGIGHAVLLAVERFDAGASVIASFEELNGGSVTFHAVQCKIPGDTNFGELQEWTEGSWAVVALSRHPTKK